MSYVDHQNTKKWLLDLKSDILKSTADKTKSSFLHMWAKMPLLSFNHTILGPEKYGNPEEVPGEVWCKDLWNDLHLGKLMPWNVYAYMLECLRVMTRLVYMVPCTFLGFDTVWYGLNAPISTWFMTHGTKTGWNVAFRCTWKWRHNDNFQDGRTVYYNNSKWQYIAMRWSTCRPNVTNPLSNTCYLLILSQTFVWTATRGGRFPGLQRGPLITTKMP